MKSKSSTVAATVKPSRGLVVRVMSAEERSADMKEFGTEIRKDKASAVAFLQRAGSLDASGSRVDPYRA